MVCMIRRDGRRKWYQRDQYHRLAGPSIIGLTSTSWYQNGGPHRLNGPAIEWIHGQKEWYQNGRRHRLDGPAVELPDGSVQYYINGVFYRKSQWEKYRGV